MIRCHFSGPPEGKAAAAATARRRSAAKATGFVDQIRSEICETLRNPSYVKLHVDIMYIHMLQYMLACCRLSVELGLAQADGFSILFHNCWKEQQFLHTKCIMTPELRVLSQRCLPWTTVDTSRQQNMAAANNRPRDDNSSVPVLREIPRLGID